ncbi:MAG: regulatory protein RecX [Oscillospiraceae bacterium]|nr:regulatory protein RecX [Oscillospiraceae bacterium]
MKIISIALWKEKIFAVKFENGKGLYLHSDILAQFALRVGDDLPLQRIAEIRQAAADRRTFEYALHLLDRRGYSSRELYDKLMAAQKADETASQRAIARLTEYGVLDDARYAAQLAELYIVSRKYGLHRAAAEMRKRGLSSDEIEDALAPYAETESVQEQLSVLLKKKYAQRLTDPDDRHARELVTASLIRRGFDYADIRTALEDYFSEEE